MVETVESAVMWGEVPMARLCGIWASQLQEESSAMVGLEVGSFVDIVGVASKRRWAQW